MTARRPELTILIFVSPQESVYSYKSALLKNSVCIKTAGKTESLTVRHNIQLSEQ